MALSSGSFDEAHRHFTAATKLDPHNSVVSCKLSVISRRNARAREIQRHATRRERPSNFVRVFFPFFYISHRESSCRPILNAKFTRKVSFFWRCKYYYRLCRTTIFDCLTTCGSFERFSDLLFFQISPGRPTRICGFQRKEK